MPSPRTPRGQVMGATNQSRGAHGSLTSSAGPSARDRPRTMAEEMEVGSRSGGQQSGRSVPKMWALDRVRDSGGDPRSLTSRVSAGSSSRYLLPHIGVSPRRPMNPLDPIRSICLPVGPEYVPGPAGMRRQDVVPAYEKCNPTMVKLRDTHDSLSRRKDVLLRAFMALDTNRTGMLPKRDFSEGLKEVNKTCKLNIPRVLLDDMVEEAAEMFGPERDPCNPRDIVYYKNFVAAIEPPLQEVSETLEQTIAASSPAARMARTNRFIEKPRQNDFSILERMQAHIIQNDLRTILSLRRGLDPGSGTRETFLRLDCDRDGVIGKEDLRQNLMELGMPMADESMELILSFCQAEKRGGIDYLSFVKHFEASGRGWFNPFNPHKRLPSPPFRPRADQTSAAYAKTPPSRRQRLATAPPPVFSLHGPGANILQGRQIGPDIAMTDTSLLQRQSRTEDRRVKARRQFREYEAVRKENVISMSGISPSQKPRPLLQVDYNAFVAASVQRERESMVPVIC